MLQDKAASAFSILMAGFVMVLVLTNIIGVKLFLAFPELLPNGLFGEPITLTTGILTYPITFLFTDVVCEVYGRKQANLMVYTGFVMSLLSFILVQIALVVPGSSVWPAGIQISKQSRRCKQHLILSSRCPAFLSLHR